MNKSPSEYNGLHYYINPSKVEYVGSIERN